MYRSFVTCDDPKGVVECGFIRRSKSCKGRMEQPKVERVERKKKSTEHLLSNVVKEEVVSMGRLEECRSRSPFSFQLMEVSKGAQVLKNRVTDSWSKESKQDEKCKLVTNNLLKESLVMLGNLKEEDVRMTEVMMDSSSCREQNYQIGCGNLRVPVDGYSRDSTEELKKVIKEGIVRQNPFPDRNIDSASDESMFLSTSSSQSSMICTSNFSSTDSPISSAASEKKAKGPTLIAKLMGVEEFPSEPLQSTSKQQGPVIDVDMPRARKPPVDIRKKGPGRKTLQELLEIMHSQRLLEGNSFKEVDSHFLDPFSRHSLLSDVVPIVLIKPQSIQWSKVEKASAPNCWEERTLSKQRGLNSCLAGGTPTNRLINRDAVKDNTVTKRKIKSGKQEVNTKQKFSSKMKNFGPLTNQPEDKGAIEKKSAKVLKLAMDSRKPVGKVKDTKNPKTMSNYRNQAKVIPTETHYSQKRSTTTTSRSIYTSKTLDQKRSPMKKEKQANKPRAVTVTKRNLGQKGDEKRIDLVSIGDCTTTACQKSGQNGIKSSRNLIKEYCYNDHGSVCETMEPTAEIRRDAKSCGEVDDQLGPHERYSNESTLKALLLNNSAFLHHAKELFDLNVNVPATEVKSTDAEVRLTLDCANEIIQFRGLPQSLMTHLLPHNLFRFMTTRKSLGQLLDEVCSGVETLRTYSELAGNTNALENIQMVLERDILQNDMPTRMWGSGWRNGFSVYDMENIVYEVETRILTALVEEIFS